MSFFDKLKKGAADASKKAQITVEVNRLKMQISSKEKEIAKVHMQIGEVVYEGIQNGRFEAIYEQLQMMCSDIALKQEDIVQVNEKIKLLRNEKNCPACKKVGDAEAKFCLDCGHKFEEKTVTFAESELDESSITLEEQVLTSEVVCRQCNHPIERLEKFCGSCGLPIKE